MTLNGAIPFILSNFIDYVSEIEDRPILSAGYRLPRLAITDLLCSTVCLW